jgi:hypothetical protein
MMKHSNNRTSQNFFPVNLPGGECKLVVEGSWLKIARVFDELWLEHHPVDKLPGIVAALSNVATKPDIFTCGQPLTDLEKQYEYPTELDNFAVADTEDYEAWAKTLSQASRKNFRRAARRGVTVGVVEFDDALVEGIKQIYDETPFRQGRRFPHYGKPLDAVRSENGTYLDRAVFIGAHYREELIGFMKIVLIGKVARIMQIVSKDAHTDKRPTNALLNEAVRVCGQRGVELLVYGQYVYDNKKNSPVTEFKRRNGFRQVEVPRYYVPLTTKGKLAIALGLHRGIKEVLPEWITTALLDQRSKRYERLARKDMPEGGGRDSRKQVTSHP